MEENMPHPFIFNPTQALNLSPSLPLSLSLPPPITYITYMAMFGFVVIFFLTLLAILVVHHRRRRATALPTNWAVVGMLPGLLRNCDRVHDYVTEIAAESGGTFQWKGPILCNMNMLLTVDPANIHHILSKNFANYPKGPEFKRIFEILGDGIFNADSDLWELHRRTTLSFMAHPGFHSLLERAVWRNVDAGLIPVLDHFCEQGRVVDLQDVFQRLAFDTICNLVLDCEPRSLCVEMPYVACEKAFNDAMDALLYRHILPEGVWRLQRWLGVGKEKKLLEASKAFDDFIYPCVDRVEEERGDHLSLLASIRNDDYFGEKKASSPAASRKFLRDTALNLMLAGRDTTSTTLTWLFWLLATNHNSQIKIREEIEAELPKKQHSYSCGTKEKKEWRWFDVEESRKLIYLHGALCESLRLFPPVALEHKAPIRPDNLPSGNKIEKGNKLILSFYSVGRMERVWGEDCLEFKPERWITSKGGVKHEPSYKFPAFNAGPRTCLGKEMAFAHMKMVAVAIIDRYDIRLVEGHIVAPRDSIILQTRNGLMVRLSQKKCLM